MDVKPIRTEEDYEAALEEIDRLIDTAPNTPEADKLAVLATLVEAYETDHYPIPLPDPISAIEYYMDIRGLSRRDLEPYIGSRGRVSEVMNRKRALTLRMIRNLEHGLNIPASVLIQEYELTHNNDTTAAQEDTRYPNIPAALLFVDTMTTCNMVLEDSETYNTED